MDLIVVIVLLLLIDDKLIPLRVLPIFLQELAHVYVDVFSSNDKVSSVPQHLHHRPSDPKQPADLALRGCHLPR